jgi:hypothetical protein
MFSDDFYILLAVFCFVLEVINTYNFIKNKEYKMS